MGRRSALSAHHRAVIGSNLMSPRRRRRCRVARREGPSGPYGKFVTTVNATLAGQQENCCGLRGGRKPLFDFRVAGSEWEHGRGDVQLLENMERSFFKNR